MMIRETTSDKNRRRGSRTFRVEVAGEQIALAIRLDAPDELGRYQPEPGGPSNQEIARVLVQLAARLDGVSGKRLPVDPSRLAS